MEDQRDEVVAISRPPPSRLFSPVFCNPNIYPYIILARQLLYLAGYVFSAYYDDVGYCVILSNIIGQLPSIAGWDVATYGPGVSRVPRSFDERRFGVPRLAIVRDHLMNRGCWEGYCNSLVQVLS